MFARLISTFLVTGALELACAVALASGAASTELSKQTRANGSDLSNMTMASAAPSAAASARCETVLAPQKMYPMGSQGAQDEHLQFGFESEYLIAQSDKLLLDYALKGYSTIQWRALSAGERLTLVQAKLKQAPIFAEPSGLIKIATETEKSFLPNELVYDATGNLEIVLLPVDTLQEWKSRVVLVNSWYGAGSMQGMISVPRKFLNPDSVLGWLNFTNESDTLSKLQASAERFKLEAGAAANVDGKTDAKTQTKTQTKSYSGLRSFEHIWLGPMTLAKQKRLKQYLEANAKGEKLDSSSLYFMKTDAAFKYFGGTAYRPDIATKQGRAGFEQRSAHMATELLLEQVERDAHALRDGTGRFEMFKAIDAYDSEKTYAQLPQAVRAFLEKVVPSVGPSYLDAESILTRQPYRNFGYPLKDWSQWVLALSTSGPEQQHQLQAVIKAQVDYVRKLEQVESSFSKGETTKDQALVAIRKALAEFVEQSQLAQMFGQLSTKLFAK